MIAILESYRAGLLVRDPFYAAWNMSDAHRFAIVLKTAPRADVGILVMTFLLAVFSGLVLI